MLKVTKRDFVFCICTLLIAGCICAFVYGFGLKNGGDTVEIFCQNQKIASLILAEDQIFELNKGGAHLTVEIRNKTVDITDSACSGQDCVHTPPISRAGQVILCAKQNVLIRITSHIEPDGVVV